MIQKDNGGPAFPHCYEASGHPRWCESQGLSIRDYFAAAALTGLSANPEGPAGDWGRLADQSYAAADALLKARTQGE